MTSRSWIAASGWSLFLRWIGAGVLGSALGLIAASLLTVAAAWAGADPDRFVIYAMVICLGVALGLAQQPVIAPLLPGLRPWFTVTWAGFALALLLFLALQASNLVAGDRTGTVLLVALMGVTIGCTQWWILSRRYRGAAVWVVASALGGLAFLWLYDHPAGSLLEMLVVGSLLGGVASLATGATLVWLVARPRRPNEASAQ